MNSSIFCARRTPLLGLGLALLASSVLLASCQQQNANTVVTTLPDTATTPAAVAQTPSAAITPKAGTLSSVFIPGENAVLTKHEVSPKTLEAQNKSGSIAPALQEIVLAAPDSFPKGTKINSAKVQGDKIVVDVNQNFATDEFWSQSGEKTTELAIYSLVNSAAQSDKKVKGVELTVAGKPLPSIGEMDTGGVIEPRAEMTGSS